MLSSALKDNPSILNFLKKSYVAEVPDATWNLDAWNNKDAIPYSGIKEALRILGINPNEFFMKLPIGYKAKGWYQNLPNRKAKIDIEDLFKPKSLSNGTLNFVLKDNELMKSENKYLTFPAGTKVVMYDHLNNKEILSTVLKEDVQVHRLLVQFREV